MDNAATLNVFCHTKKIEHATESDSLKLSLHKARAEALFQAFESVPQLWSVTDWGFTTADEYRDQVYMNIECRRPEQLEVQYIQENGTLTSVKLPDAVIVLLEKLVEKQRAEAIGAFNLFVLENHLQVTCAEDGKADFKFTMKDYRIKYDVDLSNAEFEGKPSISFD